jgi:hypothetical protein
MPNLPTRDGKDLPPKTPLLRPAPPVAVTMLPALRPATVQRQRPTTPRPSPTTPPVYRPQAQTHPAPLPMGTAPALAQARRAIAMVSSAPKQLQAPPPVYRPSDAVGAHLHLAGRMAALPACRPALGPDTGRPSDEIRPVQLSRGHPLGGGGQFGSVVPEEPVALPNPLGLVNVPAVSHFPRWETPRLAIQAKLLSHRHVIQLWMKRPSLNQYPTNILPALVKKQSPKKLMNADDYIVCAGCDNLVHYLNCEVDHWPESWANLKAKSKNGDVPDSDAFKMSNLRLLCRRCNASNRHNQKRRLTRNALKSDVEESLAKKRKLF